MMKISVIIPTYSGEKFIQRAIESVLNQTFQDFEIIVVDDCSRDNTVSVVKDLQKKDSRIKLIELDKNSGGPALPKNKGFEVSTGKFIAYLDHDDEWLLDKLSQQMNLFINSKKKNLGLVSCGAYLVNDPGKLFGIYTPIINNKSIFPYILLGNLIHSNSSVLIKREVIDSVGPRDENMKYSEDWDMWIRIAKAGYDMDFISKPLFKYYFHNENVTKTSKKDIRVKDAEYVFSKHQDLYLKYNYVHVGLFRLGVMYFLGGNAKKSREFFIKSIEKNKVFLPSYFGYLFSMFGIVGVKIINFLIFMYRLLHGKTYLISSRNQ